MKQKINDIKKFLILVREVSSAMIFCGILKAFFEAINPYISIYMTSRVLDCMILGNLEEALNSAILMVVITFGFNSINRILYQYQQAHLQSIDNSITLKTVYKAYTMEYEEYEKNETMVALRRCRDASNSTGGPTSLFNNLMDGLNYGFSILFALVFVGKLIYDSAVFQRANVEMILILGAMILIYLFSFGFSWFNGKRIGKLDKEYWLSNEKNNNFSRTVLGGLIDYKNGKDIRIFKMQDFMMGKYDLWDKVSKDIYITYGKKAGILNGQQLFFFVLASGLTYLFVGEAALAGAVSIGSVLMYARAIESLTMNISEFIKKATKISFQIEYVKLIEEFINKPNIHQLGTIPTEKRWDRKYQFSFEDVSFTYPGTNIPVLNHINCTFDANEKTAIVGRNGAGKTTLVKLLCRLYEPTSGRILLNGIDIQKYDFKEYVDLFSVVFQDFKLFPYSISENIASGELFDKEKINQSLEMIGMKNRVKRMPERMNTPLYKNYDEGQEISGGEAQKLAIARALYKDAPFVILDEPTSALDPISEAEIYNNFNQLIQNKSALFISHRMSSCKFCDKILVFEKGSIQECGTHNELMAINGIYRDLFEAQAQYYK